MEGQSAGSLLERAERAVSAVPQTDAHHQASLHGTDAARRQSITELLFFASVGDLNRCRRICRTWGIKVGLLCCLEASCKPQHQPMAPPLLGLVTFSAGVLLVDQAEKPWWLLSTSCCVCVVVCAASRSQLL